MNTKSFLHRPNLLFILLGGFFITNALLAELIGVKIFSLEYVLGMQPVNMSFFGHENLAFNLTAGVVLWPIVFIMTDIINEYYGRKGIRLLSYFTAALIVYAFFAITLAIHAPPADFWPTSHLGNDLPEGDFRKDISNYDSAFRLIFGQGQMIIVGSLVAFIVGQILDVYVFHRIKRWTGERYIWLRATGSTIVSQFIDCFIVLFIAFYIGAGWDFRLVMAICMVNYLYKFMIAILITPLLYVAHYFIDRFLGQSVAEQMKKQAMTNG